MIKRVVGKSPSGTARYDTLEEFIAAVERNPQIDWRRNLLPEALENEDLVARVQIATWMLDHGVDAEWVNSSDKANVLHIMFQERIHDFETEAPVLQRILDAGADINLWSPKWGVPMQLLLENPRMSEPEVFPFYDVIFSHPGIDWNAYMGKTAGQRLNLANYVDSKPNVYPDFHRRMHHYLEHGPAPRPTFN
ncbi:MAG: hypothetical protein Q4D79_04485 [Propionibacteriaceae bacterium]|nr:hypothetical protein [Propionibacteriaceae bacterium]